jgi:nucleoside-diphosphate-sugar epimerase
MSRCLVTGHKGYIGTHLFNKLNESGHEVRGIDLQEEEDILDGLEHLEDFAPEYVFHLACIPRVAYSVDYPVHTAINNIISTSLVLDFAKKVGVKRVIYSGSSSVVGNGDGPTSPYALQKLTSELETKLYAQLYGVDTVTLRYFNVYSEDQKATSQYATAVSNWMHYIRQGKNPFITGEGDQRRDMLYVHDAVSANIFAMEYNESFQGRTFDVGTGNNISLNEMKEIVRDYRPDVDFDYVVSRPGDVMYTKADTNSLSKLGWRAEVSIENGIRKCFGGLK